MIIPHFRYCITSWSQASKSVLRPLESLYKNALKIHDKKQRRFHHCHILRKYSILSFENVIIYSNVCLLFKIIRGVSAPPLKTFVSLNSEMLSRTTRSTDRGECRVPRRRTALGNSAFSCVATRQWNLLPTELITCTNFYTFSRLAKRWLLSRQTCSHNLN